MRNSAKKSIITILALFFACACCVLCVVYFGAKVNTGVQAAGSIASSEKVDVPSGVITDADETDGFNMLDKASVRLTSDGLRFETEITKGFYNGLDDQGDVEFIAVVTNSTDGITKAYKFGGLPTFEANAEDSAVFSLKTYLNFDGVSEEKLTAAYSKEFITAYYAKLTVGDDVSYVKAYQPGGDVKRSMRAVAASVYMNYDANDENIDFERDEVKKYFGGDIETDDVVDSYTFDTAESGEIVFKLPDSFVDPADGGTITAYLNAKEYVATYDADKDRYVINDVEELVGEQLGVEKSISVFDSNGKLYSTKTVQATKLHSGNLDELKNATTGAFVLTEDIDLNGEVWQDGETQKRNLIFDGNGHSIKNIAYAADVATNGDRNYHCFFTNFGGIIRNTYFDISNHAGNYRGLIGQIRGETTIENVVISYDKFGSYNGGGVGAMTASNVTLKNVLINFGSFSNGGTNYGAIIGGYNGVDSAVVTTENVHIVNPSKDTYSNLLPVGTINGTSGEDYFVYDSFETVGEKALENQLDEGINALVEDNLTFALNQDNIDMLKTATIGYYYLTDDIDMDGIVWDPSADFSGVLNGKDFEISNFTATAGFNDGLFQYTEDGAIIKNLNLHAVTNTTYGLLAGQVRGRTLLNNVVIDVDTLDCSYSSGCITSVVQGELTVKDSIFNIDNATGSATTVGFIAGGQSPSNNVIVDNVWAFVPTTALASPYTVSEEVEYYTYTTSGQIASNGNGYNVYAITTPDELVYFDTSIIPDSTIKAYADKIIPEKYDAYGVTLLDNDNFSDLKGAANGYYLLTADIEMSDVSWTNTGTFAGTFNGNGHVIKSLSGSLFSYISGSTIKNVAFSDAKPGNSGVITGQIHGIDTIKNVVAYITGTTGTANYTSLIGWQTKNTSELTVEDVVVYAPNLKGGSMGFLTSYGVDHMSVNNVHCIGSLPIYGVNSLGSNNNYLTVAELTKLDGTTEAEKGTDYFIYADVDTYYNSIKDINVISTELSQMVNKTGIVTELTEENFAQLLTATSGYYILTEDIDMTGVSFAPSDATVFTGTLNGNGKKITNFTPCGSNYVGLFARGDGATIKNLTIHYTKSATRAGLFGRVQGAGTTVVENCNIIVDVLNTYYGTTIANAISGQLIVRDTLVYIKDSSSANVDNSGALGSKEASTKKMIVDNVVIVDAKGKFTKLIPDANVTTNVTYDLIPVGVGGSNAVNGTDYFLYSSVEAVETARQGKTLPEGFEARLVDAGVLTKSAE